MKGKAEFLEHTADLKIRFTAGTLDALLTLCGCTLRDYLYGPVDSEGGEEVHTTVEGDDDVERFIRSLNEILFSLQTRRLMICAVRVQKAGKAWNLLFTGSKGTGKGASTEIKAATYHQAAFADTPGGIEAVAVFDL
jgi:SHS2 domain-containing protein